MLSKSWMQVGKRNSNDKYSMSGIRCQTFLLAQHALFCVKSRAWQHAVAPEMTASPLPSPPFHVCQVLAFEKLECTDSSTSCIASAWLVGTKLLHWPEFELPCMLACALTHAEYSIVLTLKHAKNCAVKDKIFMSRRAAPKNVVYWTMALCHQASIFTRRDQIVDTTWYR